jgi:N-acetyltransferase
MSAERRTIPFDLQPTLRGDLLELRPLRPDDFEVLYAVAEDPLIWEQHPKHDRWKRDVFQAFFEDALASRGAFLVLDAKGGSVIGSTRYHALEPERSQVEIGFTFLARSCWGGAYNGEMKRLMLEHAFRFVESVVFIVGERNFRSQKAVEKIGGVREGTRVEPDGRVSVIFRIRASVE